MGIIYNKECGGEMTNSDHKQSRGLISNAFGVAKKLSTTGLSLVNHVAPGTVSKLTQTPDSEQIVNGSARLQSPFEKKQYENPQQMMREHLPKVSSQLLGRHYKKINQVASFISPDLNDKLSDYVFDKLNDAVSQLTSVQDLLKEVGAKSLEELAKDPERAARISTAFANQNKMIAALQGALTGSAGVVGAVLDVPTSLALALRSIYHTGRAYGFELKAEDQAIVEYIFKQIDIGTVAEKQALLAAVRALSQVAQTHNICQLQQLLGSGNDVEVLKKFIANDDGSFKWGWMNNLPHIGFITRLTPLATMGISAVYSWKLVDDATDQAQHVFAGARQYLIQHPNEILDALSAFEKFSALSSVPLLNSEHDLLDAAPINEEIVIQGTSESRHSKETVQNSLDEEETIKVEPSNASEEVQVEAKGLGNEKNSDTSVTKKPEEASTLEKSNEQSETENAQVETTETAIKKRTPRKTTVKRTTQVKSKTDTTNQND